MKTEMIEEEDPLSIGQIKNVTASNWTNIEGHIIGIRFLPGRNRLNFFQLRLVTDYERHKALTAIC